MLLAVLITEFVLGSALVEGLISVLGQAHLQPENSASATIFLI